MPGLLPGFVRYHSPGPIPPEPIRLPNNTQNRLITRGSHNSNFRHRIYILDNVEEGRALPTGRMPLNYRLHLMVVAASTGLLAGIPGFQTGGIIIDMHYV